MAEPELQMLRISQRYFFFLFNQNICCDPSLELSQGDSSNDGSQNMVLWKNMVIIPKLSLLPVLIWNSAELGILKRYHIYLAIKQHFSIS